MPKRRRTEDDDASDPGSSASEPTPKEWAKHKDLWFDDGNVILAAGNTLFRVYRGLLANASPIFRDMFSIPQPADAETMEGCQVVYLDDPEWDMEIFLELLHKGYSMDESGIATLGVARALLYFGDKYQAEDLATMGRKRIEDNFLPGNIEDWMTMHDSDVPEDETQHDPDSWDIEDSILIANVTRRFKLHDMHLRALYICSQLNMKALLAGRPGPDGKLQYLCSEDLAECVDCRPRLQAMEHKLKMDLAFQLPATKCCHLSRSDVRNALWKSGTTLTCHDPLAGKKWIREYCLKLEPFRKMCAKCVLHYEQQFLDERQKILDNLGKYIKIEPF
ncbi:hypothetical protein EIP91_004961 [Steccherinum ochraceum]|uniref:BTB domain-containing protein n=1 Tax=Steccherinum ochraceum TaxID=92696 RepID=A0A4R0RJ11_9APHY|nr:hypothetical protein EIP91_004961 [Steccherinum ochraceum]